MLVVATRNLVSSAGLKAGSLMTSNSVSMPSSRERTALGPPLYARSYPFARMHLSMLEKPYDCEAYATVSYEPLWQGSRPPSHPCTIDKDESLSRVLSGR